MKNKILSLLGLSVLAVLLFVSFGSALDISTTPPTINDFTRVGQSQIITINGDGNFNLTVQSSPYLLPNVTSVFDVISTTLNITLNSLPSAIGRGTVTITAVNLTDSSDTDFFDLVYVKSFCNSGPINDTNLKLNVKIKNQGEGDKDEWQPLDIIKVEVEFENNLGNNVDLDDIVIKLGLYKKGTTTNIIDDMIWISDDEEEFELGDVDDGKEASHTFEFKVDPLEIDNGEYYLVVKAFPDGKENNYCIDKSADFASSDFGQYEYFAEIDIVKEDDRNKMVIIDEESLPKPIEGLCGGQVTFTADIYNIGDKEFEDQILVTLYNKELGLDLKKVVLGDLDAGERTEVSFSFNIPSDAEEKQYTLSMRTFYDYDEGDGKYEDDYDRISDDTFVAYLKVSGNCVAVQPVSVSASLESGGKAGEEMVVKVTVTNTGTKAANYNINIAKYSGWASLISVEPDNFSLNKAEAKEVLLTFDVKKGVSGEQSFDIEILSGGQLVATKPVSVLIEKSGLFSITGGLISEENWYLWGLGAFNIILIIVIILVAVRVARKRE